MVCSTRLIYASRNGCLPPGSSGGHVQHTLSSRVKHVTLHFRDSSPSLHSAASKMTMEQVKSRQEVTSVDSSFHLNRPCSRVFQFTAYERNAQRSPPCLVEPRHSPVRQPPRFELVGSVLVRLLLVPLPGCPSRWRSRLPAHHPPPLSSSLSTLILRGAAAPTRNASRPPSGRRPPRAGSRSHISSAASLAWVCW
jgi:hypothetical protein